MVKPVSLYRHIKSIVLLPFLVIVIIPSVILNYVPAWQLSFALGVASELFFGIGILLALMSIAFFISVLILFIRMSQGTLAPWDPSRKLVVRSYYRHTRNPMILAVASILLSLAFIFDSIPLLGWCGLFLAINHAYIIWKEEPDLLNRFGEDYDIYQSHVPRWWPRRRGWRPEDASPSEQVK